MERYILDANLFFNMEAGLGLGEKTEVVVKKLTEMVNKLKAAKRAEFYMPPRVVDEFLSFFDNKEQQFLKNFLSGITVKSPDIAKATFPAQVFYELVADIRQRSYRGLNIGEEEIEKAGRVMLGKNNLSTKDFQIQIGSVVKKFRERYRQATRFGFLDSVADLDLVVLAKELDGFLISTDEGVIHWGRLFGVKETPVGVWKKKLDDLLS
ncbi:RNA ligase partner protein [Candidatus Roizmanbacteria bacterium RIFCSPHIGHO2_02_FULL_37_15]|uniref:RNA ligase partner protein n=1 Tax=Candidatus Roizmanbacteria bacterium RIFCSPLOWO2_01_FULL_37_16 TaxID=1802058 RepID=A0A1F7INT2_9BACT|nr:MAG: RNA ligase partner protein [Candidatus Roizmanbacteria bacterium RIFCSPHIGHO2_01_FULL_37_16b]OGK21353.1 MAG: RNA ligase partner protein [Candidatus Roizmanbacteria bacterium RIFCSPHIGHO2_02_FULL_37_15]OGK32284.1 MAG: RNA ligase partner protein [Candidatus Roizmanbacteria bacterium RIFCSPHIGHO2_12_FULL_36_11]OGK45043.1 MAG: RNA ligase partner protein [Candidatus Roizmanbacteria bacterium RIFCSPLOWO2_01_FULL_37_16]